MAISSIGTRGTEVSGASTTTIARAPTATVNVGRVLIAHFATRENVAISTLADVAGNTWELIGRYSHSGTGDAHNEVWLCNVTTQLTTGTTITATFDSTIVDKCMALWEYSVGSGNVIRTVEPVVGNEVNAANGFGSATFAGLASQERLYFRSGSKRANSTGTITATSGYTTHALNIRSRNSSTLAITLRAEHLIATNTGTTSNPTWAVSGNTAANFVAFEEYAPPAAQSLTQASSFDNRNTFYATSITLGAVSLTPVLYENSNTFYTHEVTQPVGSQDLTASLFTNDNAFYAASISVGAVSLTASLFENSNAFYTHALTAGAVNLSADLYSNSNAFYAHSLATGVVGITPSLYINTNEFYAARVTAISVSINAEIFTNNNTFYSHNVNRGAVSLSAGLFNNTNEFYAPNLNVADETLALEIFVNSNTFYAHRVSNYFIRSKLRTLIIEYENRCIVAAAESRAISIDSDYRRLNVTYENRALTVEKEVRTVFIK